MRQHRRVSFAAPFVMVVGALGACGGAKKPEPLHDNPPGPQTAKLTPEQCKEIQHDAPCAPDDRCEIATGCGLNGYECRDGKWHELMTLCNPPPPGAEVPPAGPAPAVK